MNLLSFIKKEKNMNIDGKYSQNLLLKGQFSEFNGQIVNLAIYLLVVDLINGYIYSKRKKEMKIWYGIIQL